MGKYSVFSFLVGVSIPFLFCLATCYAPERRFRGCKEFENYRSFVTPYTLIATDVAWTIVARRLGEAVSFGVASTDITAHRAYSNQWSVARCGFFAFGVTTISAFVSPFVSGMRAVYVAGGLGTVAGPLSILVC